MKILIFLITLMAFSCTSETDKQRYLPMTVSISMSDWAKVQTSILDSHTGDTFLLLHDDNTEDYYWLKSEFTPDRVRVR